jgi:hypothetical protein
VFKFQSSTKKYSHFSNLIAQQFEVSTNKKFPRHFFLPNLCVSPVFLAPFFLSFAFISFFLYHRGKNKNTLRGKERETETEQEDLQCKGKLKTQRSSTKRKKKKKKNAAKDYL